MNVVLGNGLIGLLAAKILGWHQVPIGQSRFYSLDHPLADDYIRYADDVAAAVGVGPAPSIHKILFSLGGQLHEYSDALADAYLQKVYGEVDVRLRELTKSGFQLNTSCRDVYRSFPRDSGVPICSINQREHVIYFVDGRRLAYDEMISTVPLPMLIVWTKGLPSLSEITVRYCHVVTEQLDFEGADEVLVVDDSIPFFKVVKRSAVDYIFWSHESLSSSILQPYFNDCRVINATTIRGALTKGPLPDLSSFEADGIRCIGSNAQWDERMDVSSCIRRITKTSTSTQQIARDRR